jgi:hypothetical protein
MTAACGGGTTVQSSDGVAAAGPLPTLPSVQERFPDAYTDDGCPVADPDSCLSTAAEADRAAAQPDAGPDVERLLLGFHGTGWLVRPTAGSVRVLTETVTVPSGEQWTAVGLVRNETAEAVDGVEVTATLLDASGATLAVARGDVAPAPLRSGEPAPFSLEAPVTTDQVASVQWDTTAAPAASEPDDGRRQAASVAWTRPFGGDPIDTYLYTDAPDARPYVLFGTLENLGRDAPGADVAIAWRDTGGRVLHVEVLHATCVGSLPADGTCDILAVVPDLGHTLDDASISIWTWVL